MTTQPEALRLAEYLETYGPRSNINCTSVQAAAELRRLHDLLQQALDDTRRLHELQELYQDKARRLQAENEALRADAERYRWLRDNAVGDAERGNYGVILTRRVAFEWHSPSWEAGQRTAPVSLDAAIDAARSKT